MKKLIAIAISFLLIQGCSENSMEPLTEPIVIEETFGLQGTVIDTAGIPISGVQIYCLFDYGYIPDSTEAIINKNAVVKDSSFGNELHQNFPNPFSKDTYIRFSILEESKVNFTISSKLDGRNIYQETDTLPYGLYQRYFNELGYNDDFKNGSYEVSLTITTLNDSLSELKKELFIVNDRNKPNSISNDTGGYTFNYNDAFINDTVKECSIYYPDQVNNHVIGNNIFLLFKKAGYITKYIQFMLYPKVLINQNIILENEGGQ